MTKEFTYRTYGRSELAALYSPDISPIAAWRKLKDWIARYPDLTDALRSCGYKDSQRVFTPMQVRLIVNALGEP